MMGIFSTIFNRELVDHKKLVQEGAILIDVRTKSEFQIGHARNSKNRPLDELSDWSRNLKETDRVVLVCKSGVRAGVARRQLSKRGIEAYNAGAWQRMS